MPRSIFEIDELLRSVVDGLVETSPRAVLSLALTCRSLEEPTLSSLWGRQESFGVLVKVFPSCTRVEDDPSTYGTECAVIERDASTTDLARFRRYASWMRGLTLGSDNKPTSDTIFRLLCNSSEVLFPKLEWLRWCMWETSPALPFSRLFLPPHLKRLTLYANPYPDPSPPHQLETIAQMVSFLPTSLEDLIIHSGYSEEKVVQDAVSSFICRCGPSLRSFDTWVPISEAAIYHLIQLPNLSNWNAIQGPPETIPASILPSIEDIRLDKPEHLPWLHLLTSHTNIKLKSLDLPPSSSIGSALLSCVMQFRNLVTLHVGAHYPACTEICLFRLTDDDMENLVTALPRLQSLLLGRPCHHNSCNTTVASLVSISVHCLDLVALETHFNTQTIVGDMKRLLDGGAGRDKAKCKIESLSVWGLPLEIRDEDTETVATGFKDIFPHLKNFGHFGTVRWVQLGFRLEDRGT